MNGRTQCSEKIMSHSLRTLIMELNKVLMTNHWLIFLFWYLKGHYIIWIGCFLIMIHILCFQILWQTVCDVHYANVDVLVSHFDFCWTENKNPKTVLISKVSIEVEMRTNSCCESIHFKNILEIFLYLEFKPKLTAVTWWKVNFWWAWQ